jgi:hypothetical protein
VLAAISLPQLNTVAEMRGEFDYIHLFVKRRAELDNRLPLLKAHLAKAGKLWVSWPKNRGLGTDLALPAVIAIGYSHGLVESTCLSIDAVWSGLRFTWPKPAKVYRNRYGRLPETPDPGKSQGTSGSTSGLIGTRRVSATLPA